MPGYPPRHVCVACWRVLLTYLLIDKSIRRDGSRFLARRGRAPITKSRRKNAACRTSSLKTSNRDGRVTFLPMRWTGGQLRAVLAAKPPQRIFRARVPNFPQWMFRWTRGDTSEHIPRRRGSGGCPRSDRIADDITCRLTHLVRACRPVGRIDFLTRDCVPVSVIC